MEDAKRPLRQLMPRRGQPIPWLLYSAMPFAGWIEIAVNFPEEDMIPYIDGWPFFVYSNIIG